MDSTNLLGVESATVTQTGTDATIEITLPYDNLTGFQAAVNNTEDLGAFISEILNYGVIQETNLAKRTAVQGIMGLTSATFISAPTSIAQTVSSAVTAATTIVATPPILHGGGTSVTTPVIKV